ncbi:hypothetical protein MC52_001760 [Klebsiella michiganensis]|uniref:hypothetical protein n=1 Tax=Klebsiella michiganensis TaxID=1134687 RepID=UPI00053851F6|nr:hypothetical protein [Klebsiella michiganensis]PNO46658.1 hypothetical protein MC52_001760 [Klebsiella michiganensis]
MNIETVNELIQSLESAGELSIKETKVMALAKAYQQLAAENLQIKAMNDCLSEELRGYESDGAFEGPKMHLLWWQVETPATDRIVAEAEARGVEKFAAEQRGVAERLKKRNVAVAERSISFCLESAEEAEVFAQQLREGAK